MKDIHSGMTARVAIAASTYSATTAPPAVDLQGFNTAEIVVNIGEGGIVFSNTNKVEFILTHSDDGSTFAPVTAKDVLGIAAVTDGIVKTLAADHPTAAAYRLGYVGTKRYLKLQAKFSGTHGTGTALAAVVIAGEGHDSPQPDQV